MDAIDHQRWAATRARGRRRFVCMRGVLGFGLPYCLMMFMGDAIGYLSGWRASVPWIGMGFIWLGMMIPIGILHGFLVWAINERQFRRHELS